MSENHHWIARIPNLAPETASLLSDELEQLQDNLGATHHAVASFCAGNDDDWAVEISYQSKPDKTQISELLSLYRCRDGAVPSAQFHRIEDRDWVAESLHNLAPVSAGRFFVHGRHDRDQRPAGAIGIEIEASQAFGTGHHPTSVGCLEALDRDLRHTRFKNSLDLGCGSALLAIAIARTGLGNVLATDIDPVAIDIANENICLNKVANRIKCFVAEGLSHPQIRKRRPFDLIMANILSGPLIALANPMRDYVAQAGTIILSGILTRQASRVEAAYLTAGFRFKRRLINGEWATLVLNNQGHPRDCMKS